MRRKTEGQKQCDSIGQVGGGYRKETVFELTRKSPSCYQQPLDFIFRALVLQQPLLESSTPAHFSPAASKTPPTSHNHSLTHKGLCRRPWAPHDSPPPYLCSYFPELSQLGRACLSPSKNKQTTKGN